MPPRKERVAVVLDTNVIVGYYLSRVPQSANARIFWLWRDQRKLQLIVSDEVVTEYLEVLPQSGTSDRKRRNSNANPRDGCFQRFWFDS